jgi:hypothetical protein
VRLRLEFEPRDLWIGAFWKREAIREAVPLKGESMFGTPYDGVGFIGRSVRVKTDIWICVVPCVALHLSWLEDHRP